MNRAARRMLPSLLRTAGASPSFRPPSYPVSRSLATASSIAALLSSASASKPLKDAVKFTGPSVENPAVWTYHELSRHVSALSAGLSELALAPRHVLLTLLHPHTQEYAVTLLAAAQLGLKVVAIPPPADPAVTSVQSVNDALRKYQPAMLILGKDFSPAGTHPEHDGIVAAVNPLVNALAPGVALDDARGLDGFVPLTGRAFSSKEHPYLRHVVHTGDTNVRGTITFKSLLVYNGMAPPVPSGELPLLVDAATDAESSTAKILKDAEAIGKEMRLSKDHTTKEGKIVVTPKVSERSAAAIVAAVMHETLWVSPGTGDVKAVSEAENALVI